MPSRGERRRLGVESQADEFAGQFLMSPDILREEYDHYLRNISAADPDWHEVEGMRAHVAQKIAQRFGVNHQVVETRFDREGIWPVE